MTETRRPRRTQAAVYVLSVDARAEALAASELRLLAEKSLELADRYERDAEFMEDEQERQIALALSRWRRHRGRYFRELSAKAELIEATQVSGR
jgi:hypothetical protein